MAKNRGWIQDIDVKVDRLLESFARLETSVGQVIARQDTQCRRIEANESGIAKIKEDLSYLRGAIKMIAIVGGGILGLAVIAEVAILVLK